MVSGEAWSVRGGLKTGLGVVIYVKMPLINILWIGTFMMVFGFVIAISRRYGEFQKMRDKGVEA